MKQKSRAKSPASDGYLVDYAAKGSKVDLDGMEKVEGHDAYKLKVTTKTVTSSTSGSMLRTSWT